MNIEYIYVQKRHKLNTRSDKDIFDVTEIPESVARFLKMGSASSHCIENFVKVDKVTPPQCLDKQLNILMKHEDKVKLYLDLLRKSETDASTLELLRNEDSKIEDELMNIAISDDEKSGNSIHEEDFANSVFNIGDLEKNILYDSSEQSLMSFDSTSSSNFSLEEPSLLDSSCSMTQLDGSSDFNGLAGVECESDIISALLNIFRCFENLWDRFDDHKLCLAPHTKEGFRCMFCHMRSISLRLIQQRKK